jgi:hypothetical protein
MILDFSAPSLLLDESEIAVPGKDDRDRDWPPGSAPRTGRQSLFHAIWSKLRTKSPAGLDAAMFQLREQVGSMTEPREAHRPLSTEEVRSIASRVIEFGSHALTHASLPALGEAEAFLEVVESRARCEALTGEAPKAFAYPYGDCDSAGMRLVKDAGFRCACTTAHAFVGRRIDPFALPRLAVGNWDVRRFSDMLAGR